MQGFVELLDLLGQNCVDKGDTGNLCSERLIKSW